jgi:hypothetical protein
VPSYSSIYLTETPSDGYVFNYWTGSICSGYYSCYFTPDASAYYPSVTAYFTKKP